MSRHAEGHGQIRYDSLARRPWWFKCSSAAVGLYLAYLVITRIEHGAPWWGTAGVIAMCALIAMPYTGIVRAVVDERGVRPPVRRRIPWSQIESVQEPGRYGNGVVLRMVDGRYGESDCGPADRLP
ncbi:hypothetical protein HNR15_002590 [Allobranchiibius huperziae]|uniref:PH domain-containing protein n=1 Tax=Allobranchiibius huperziae TaxID=1874116 RepID=A0A853DG10_9MICO|nr:hypothetical protein [Allobranchiibius huperziae]